jgi:hypothetical protein
LIQKRAAASTISRPVDDDDVIIEEEGNESFHFDNHDMGMAMMDDNGDSDILREIFDLESPSSVVVKPCMNFPALPPPIVWNEEFNSLERSSFMLNDADMESLREKLETFRILMPFKEKCECGNVANSQSSGKWQIGENDDAFQMDVKGSPKNHSSLCRYEASESEQTTNALNLDDGFIFDENDPFFDDDWDGVSGNENFAEILTPDGSSSGPIASGMLMPPPPVITKTKNPEKSICVVESNKPNYKVPQEIASSSKFLKQSSSDRLHEYPQPSKSKCVPISPIIKTPVSLLPNAAERFGVSKSATFSRESIENCSPIQFEDDSFDDIIRLNPDPVAFPLRENDNSSTTSNEDFGSPLRQSSSSLGVFKSNESKMVESKLLVNYDSDSSTSFEEISSPIVEKKLISTTKPANETESTYSAPKSQKKYQVDRELFKDDMLLFEDDDEDDDDFVDWRKDPNKSLAIVSPKKSPVKVAHTGYANFLSTKPSASTSVSTKPSASTTVSSLRIEPPRVSTPPGSPSSTASELSPDLSQFRFENRIERLKQGDTELLRACSQMYDPNDPSGGGIVNEYPEDLPWISDEKQKQQVLRDLRNESPILPLNPSEIRCRKVVETPTPIENTGASKKKFSFKKKPLSTANAPDTSVIENSTRTFSHRSNVPVINLSDDDDFIIPQSRNFTHITPKNKSISRRKSKTPSVDTRVFPQAGNSSFATPRNLFTNSSTPSSTTTQVKKRKRRRVGDNPFIDDEADVSGGSSSSADENDEFDGLDDFDESFVVQANHDDTVTDS